MPIDYRNYPANWKQVRARILERAENKCEFCGVENYDMVWRDEDGAPHHATNGMEWDLDDAPKLTKIVLTIAHLCDCKPKCGIDEHLEALCQRCHLLLDLRHHIQKRHATLHSRKAVGDLFQPPQVESHGSTTEG